MKPTFVSELIKPAVSTADTKSMAGGGPGLPAEFAWREEVLRVTAIVRTWKETGPCTHGSGERYVRKHWFEVETESHGRAKIYFERRARGKNLLKRWWLFSLGS
jgi:hypothetical protein